MSQSVQLGDKTFAIRKLTMGTILRLPEEFALVSATAPKLKSEGRLPTGAEFAAMTTFVWDAINAESLNARPERDLVIGRNDFDEALQNSDFMDGVKFLAASVAAMLDMKSVLEPKGTASGNSDSSESAKSPVSSD